MEKEEVVKIRTSLGLTQVEFALELGTTVTTISRWENGVAEPSGMALKAIQRLTREEV